MPDRMLDYLSDCCCPVDMIRSEGNYTSAAEDQWDKRCNEYCIKYGYDGDECRNCWVDWLKEEKIIQG